jgi:hypothetical protein
MKYLALWILLSLAVVSIFEIIARQTTKNKKKETSKQKPTNKNL